MRTDGQTDGHDEANSRFSQFCKGAKKSVHLSKSSVDYNSKFSPNLSVLDTKHEGWTKTNNRLTPGKGKRYFFSRKGVVWFCFSQSLHANF